MLNKSLLLLCKIGLSLSIITFAAQNSFATTPKISDHSILDTNQVLKVALNSNPPSLDPNAHIDTTSDSILRNVFAGLVTYDAEGNYSPNASESWSISDDGLKITFKLRKDGKWSNGDPVTAKDFEYSWQRLQDPKNAFPAAYYLAQLSVKNAQEVLEGKLPPSALGAVAVDDYTFVVTLTNPTPWFINAITFSIFSPIHRATVEKYGDAWSKPENSVSNGPFKLTKYIPNEKIEAVANPNYWDAKNVVLTDIKWSITNQPRQAFLAYQAGDLSMVSLGKNELLEAEKNKANRIVNVRNSATRAIAFNFENPKFKDLRVRKAISLAINQDDLVNKVIKGGSTASYNWVPPFVSESGNLGKLDYFNWTKAQRIAEAQKLIAEVGYSKSNPLKFNILFPSGGDKQLLVALQNQINSSFNGAVEATIETKEYKVFLQIPQEGNDYDLISTGWAPTYNHVTPYLLVFLSNSQIRHTKYNNPLYDEYYNKAKSEVDKQKRVEYFAKAVKILHDDAVVIPTYYTTNKVLLKDNLQGFFTNTYYWLAEAMYFTKK